MAGLRSNGAKRGSAAALRGWGWGMLEGFGSSFQYGVAIFWSGPSLNLYRESWGGFGVDLLFCFLLGEPALLTVE